MSRGIIGTAKLAVALAFALPLGFFGVDYLLRGRTLVGGLALGAAVLMIAVEEYLTTPGDLPEVAAERVVGTIADREDSSDTTGQVDAAPERREDD